jgi:hypothetical protein
MTRRSIWNMGFEKNLTTATLIFLLAMGLSGCGGNSLPGAATPGAKTLKSLSISPANPVLALGKTQQFTVTGSFSDGSQEDMTHEVTWNSTQPTIAAVSSSGMAVSKQSGATMVTAASGAVSSATKLTVSGAALVSIAVAPPNPVVAKGNTQQFAATGKYSDGSTQDVTSAVAWTASPSGVAAIGSTGLASAQSVGTATVTATSGSISGTGALIVSSASLVSIVVAPVSATVPKGDTQQLSATGTYSDGSIQNLTGSVVWSSTPSSVATISGTGLATAQGVGTAAITAGAGSITGRGSLNVSAAALVSIAVTPADSSIGLGATQQLSATGTFSDGSTQDVTSSATWASGNPTVAAITSPGLALAENIGNAVISATSGSISGSGTVVVMPAAAINYFSNANTAGAPDATVTVINPGLTGGNLCAMIYVFDSIQEMNECCGCPVSADGERILSVNNDLTSNTLTQVTLNVGSVTIVSADQTSNPTCNAGAITPAGMLTSWSTHIQAAGPGVFAATEGPSHLSPLSSSQLSALQSDCSFIQKLGSGHGICSCGTGD